MRHAISHPNWKLMRLSSIDHEVFVDMKMPSSVSPMISASVPSRGSIEMFVMRISGRWLHPSARLVALDVWPTTGAVSREVRKFSNMPSTMIGVDCAGTPSSSNPNVPSPPASVASAVIDTRSLA